MTKRYCTCDSDYPMSYDESARAFYCLDCERVVPVVARPKSVGRVKRTKRVKSYLTA